MPSEKPHEEWHIDASSEAADQVVRIKDMLERLSAALAAADRHRPPGEQPDVVCRRHVLYAASLLIRNPPSSGGSKQYEVFISYRTTDQRFAKDVQKKLKAKGIEAFLAAASIDSGADWEESIFQAVRSCRVVVFLITPSSKSSNWCKYEIGAARALEKDVVCALRHVVPAKMPAGLKRFQSVEVQTEEELEELIRELATKLGR